MSAKQLKSDLLALLIPAFAQRGFVYKPLKKSEVNAGRCHLFRRITRTGSQTIELDLLGRSSFGSGTWISITLNPALRIDAISALLESKTFFRISPGSINRTTGEGSFYNVSDGEDPAVCVSAIFQTIDTIVLPRYEKYTSVESIVECLAPLDDPGHRELTGGATPSPWTAMAAIAGAYLLDKLDLCDDIARRAEAVWQSRISHRVLAEFLDLKHDFYERHLRPRGVKPDAWLPAPDDDARRRAQRQPEPRPRTLPSPTIWVDGRAGALVPARFEYGYQLLVIGTDNREFIKSLTDVAYKLTTGKYNLMMVAATRPGEKPVHAPRPISYRELVIDGKWALDWTPPPPSETQTVLAPLVDPDPLPPPPPTYPTKDLSPDNIAITRKDHPGWSPFYYRTGYAMYPATTDKSADQAGIRELIPTLSEVAQRLRSGEYRLMMISDRGNKMEILDADAVLIDGKPAAKVRR